MKDVLSSNSFDIVAEHYDIGPSDGCTSASSERSFSGCVG